MGCTRDEPTERHRRYCSYTAPHLILLPPLLMMRRSNAADHKDSGIDERHARRCCPCRGRLMQLQSDAVSAAKEARADLLSSDKEALARRVCKGLLARGHDARLLQTRGALGDALAGTPWLLRHVSVVVFPAAPPPPPPPPLPAAAPSSGNDASRPPLSQAPSPPSCICGRCCLHPWVVDPSFLDHFYAPLIHTPRYLSVLRLLPNVFAESVCVLHALVVDVCKEMEIAYGDVGMSVPPWRRTAAIASKWALPPYLVRARICSGVLRAKGSGGGGGGRGREEAAERRRTRKGEAQFFGLPCFCS